MKGQRDLDASIYKIQINPINKNLFFGFYNIYYIDKIVSDPFLYTNS